jgi:iron complex outermembrane receptor protein
MREILILTVLLLSGLATNAQSAGTIRGQVVSNDGQAVQGTVVSLLKSEDSVLVKLAIADNAGFYAFQNVKPGKYRVTINQTGFEKTVSRVFEFQGLPMDVEQLNLVRSARVLSNVTVTAKRPFVETRFDKTVINVESSPTSAGSTAMDILEKSPGVIVTEEGAISLAGKPGVIIMIDGKPTNLSATDIALMLRNMPALALDQVELMTNPSSKYDAAGKAGIINIKTKKGAAPGFNGIFNIGLLLSVNKINGTNYLLPKSQNSFSFNYKIKKTNFFGSYSPNYLAGRNALSFDKTFINNDIPTSYSNQAILFKMQALSQTLKLGADVQLNKKNTVGIAFNSYLLNGSPVQLSTAIVMDSLKKSQFKLQSVSANKVKFGNININLNWRHTFDSTGQELSTDLDYINYANVSNLLLTTDLYSASDVFLNQSSLRGNLPADINIYSVKTDYSKPFKKWQI